ncbi:hypothetical protein BJF84_24370 [Rhodococcus sp. CUA-806]|nr:hypothetical protein BJF84_24370 [Rhodococcus sp. CUA-806]
MKIRLRKNGRADAESAPVTEQHQWAGKQATATKAVRLGLFAAIGAGVVALLLVLTGIGSSAPTPSRTTTSPMVDTARQAAATDLAQDFVVAWLQSQRGDEKTLSRFVRTDGIALPTQPTSIATEPRIARVEAIKPPTQAETGSTPQGGPVRTAGENYSVVVSVSVVAVGSDPAVRPERRYFAVPVVFVGDDARAAAVPAAVPAPATAGDLVLGYRFRVGLEHSLTQSINQFLSAMVAGAGEISRYTSPGSQIRAVTPAPYTSAQITDLLSDKDFSASTTGSPADGATARVLASATVTGTDRAQTTTVQYPLTAIARGGRWEVSALDAMPLLAASTGSSATDTAGASPSGTNTPVTPADQN